MSQTVNKVYRNNAHEFSPHPKPKFPHLYAQMVKESALKVTNIHYSPEHVDLCKKIVESCLVLEETQGLISSGTCRFNNDNEMVLLLQNN